MIALLLCVAFAGAPEVVHIGSGRVADGVVVYSSHTTSVDLALHARTLAGARDVPLRKRHAQQSTLRVVQMGELDPSHFQLAWTENRVVDAGPDGSRSFELPVAGSSYDVVVGGTGPQVTQNGSRPATAERHIVEQASDLFRLLRELRAMVPGEVRIGQTVPAGTMFSGIVRDAPGQVTARGDLTLQELRSVDGVRCAVFDLRLHLTSHGELESGVEADFVADLVGVVAMEVETGWTRRLQVSGRIDVSGGGERLGQRFTMDGGGSYSSDTTLRFSTSPP